MQRAQNKMLAHVQFAPYARSAIACITTRKAHEPNTYQPYFSAATQCVSNIIKKSLQSVKILAIYAHDKLQMGI